MKNDYEFWNNYLINLKKELLNLCNIKKEIYVDLHIHSNYSADGKQSINEIIESTKNKKFDVIAITDHDTVDAYEEIFELVKNGFTKPLIIPGIEFTTDNREYGNQCHILQLFINPKDKILVKDVKKNHNAMFNRSKIQFQRLKENIAIQEVLKNNKLKISYKEYVRYIIENDMVPEYDTLCNYLMNKFKTKNITTFDILNLLEKYNRLDCYKDRKEYKLKRFNKLKEKYLNEEKNYFNTRFLLSMLAVREVDDDWWDKPSSGSLSVNSYGQLKIEEINTKFKTFFAHPTESKLNVVEKIIKQKTSIIGLEKNIRNKYENISNFNNLKIKNNLFVINGSDSHDNSLTFYEDMSFYKLDSNELKNIIDDGG